MAGEERWTESNHLILSAQNAMEEYSEKYNNTDYNFLSDFSISKDTIDIDENHVFTLMPFNDYLYKTYKVIRDAFIGVGLSCTRGDEKNIDGEILPQIVRQILKAKIIIAVIDGRNLNVLYELGIVHELNKKVIIVSKNIDKVPFDIQSKNILIYNDEQDLYTGCKDTLFKMLLNEK